MGCVLSTGFHRGRATRSAKLAQLPEYQAAADEQQDRTLSNQPESGKPRSGLYQFGIALPGSVPLDLFNLIEIETPRLCALVF